MICSFTKGIVQLCLWQQRGDQGSRALRLETRQGKLFVRFAFLRRADEMSHTLWKTLSQPVVPVSSILLDLFLIFNTRKHKEAAKIFCTGTLNFWEHHYVPGSRKIAVVLLVVISFWDYIH